MGFPSKFPSVIHESGNADFDNYMYFKVYAGAAGTPDINGISVTMAAGSTIEISVSSITDVADIYVLGSPKNVGTGLSYSGYSTEMLGGSAFLE